MKPIPTKGHFQVLDSIPDMLAGMPGFKIHRAQEGDFPKIRQLIRESGINPTGLDWRRFLVAVDPQGEMIACGQVKPHRDGSDELASIAVVPSWRKRGVATAIIEHLLESQTGLIYLTCRRSLELFYARFGFVVSGKESLPPYFRRISWLSNAMERLHIISEGIIVMQRDANGGVK